MIKSFVDYLVVGGGVAGVCCAEELCALEPASLTDSSRRAVVGLVCGRSGYIKMVTNMKRLTEMTSTFDVTEKAADTLVERIRVFQHDVCEWNARSGTVRLSNGAMITYGKLCIATGARPKCALNSSESARVQVFTLRDVESITRLSAQISVGRHSRVVVVGNGGIATELAFELEGVNEIVWAIRYSSISSTFFDEAAAHFFAPKLAAGRRAEATPKPETQLDRFTIFQRQPPKDDASAKIDIGGGDCQRSVASTSLTSASNGCALGPHWLAKLNQPHDDVAERRVRVIHGACVRRVYTEEERNSQSASGSSVGDKEGGWPVWVEFEPSPAAGSMDSGETIGADFVIEATGVTPNSDLWARDCADLKIATDKGIYVNGILQTTVPNVFAAGDVCTLVDDGKESRPHWMQIRLWTQARQMGLFCARSMAVENVLPDICFDLFTHVTTFFGYKVVLLGDFLGAKLSLPYGVHYRISPSHSSSSSCQKADETPETAGEYIKVITRDGRVHGAVLIGETDLEETMENLILDQTDISAIEHQLLDPSIDLEDYFD